MKFDPLALRRLTAISLILIILFNFYGYRLVISCMQSNSEAVLDRQVDENNYRQQDLVSIKTKLNLPYYTSSAQFERAYGSININGASYQYVKRRVYNDTLELLCLPNQVKTKLQLANNELTQALADGQASAPKKNTTIKITLPDFFQPMKSSAIRPLSVARAEYSSLNILALSAGYQLLQKRPPRTMQFIS